LGQHGTFLAGSKLLPYSAQVEGWLIVRATTGATHVDALPPAAQ
jgi:hypothetical protein